MTHRPLWQFWLSHSALAMQRRQVWSAAQIGSAGEVQSALWVSSLSTQSTQVSARQTSSGVHNPGAAAQPVVASTPRASAGQGGPPGLQ